MSENLNSDLGFRADLKIIEVIKENKFTLSAEVIPPRNGTEQSKVLTQVQMLIEKGTEFLSVTKGAGGSLRGGSLPIAQSIKEKFKKPCIAHFTCRDITPEEVENQLMDHHYFGIRNILALRGDPPQGQATWVPNEKSYPYAYHLIEQIRNLNQGRFFTRHSDQKYSLPSETSVQTDFCIGCAVYPEHINVNERIYFLGKKVEMGAEYAISQMLFNPEAYIEFLELCEKNQIRIPILPGTRVLKDQEQAHRMAKRFEVSLSKDLLNKLPEKSTTESDQMKALNVFLEYTQKLKNYGAPGLHLFVISDTELACSALSHLKQNGF